MATPAAYQIEPLEARQKKYAHCIEELRKVLKNPEKQLVLDHKKLLRFGIDESPLDPVAPAAAVLPSTIEEAAAVVKLCASLRVPMTPSGARTGLEGGAIPFAGGVVIDTVNLKRMDFDVENACVWVGAGVKKLALNRECTKRGFLFGPDPASNPSVGGMVSTSGSGMSTLRYGTTRENVISLKVVTPAGDVLQTRQVVRKSSAGLELTQLYIGSEGTLGIICEVCFRLFPLTKYAAGGYAGFEKLGDAVRAVVALRQRGFPQTLLRCELMNKEIVIGANSYNKLKLPPMTLVLLEFTSNDWWLRDIKRDYRFVEAIFKEAGHPTQMRYLRPGKETEDVWTARRQCHFSAMHARGAKGPEKCFGTDICVPLPKLTEMIDFTEEKFQEANKACYLCAHISDGNYHLIIPYADKAEFELLQSIEEKLIKKAIALGGTITGEHGIGCCKVCYVVQEHGQAHIDVQEAIKKALDTDNVMNPGCFYPSQVAQYHPSHL